MLTKHLTRSVFVVVVGARKNTIHFYTATTDAGSNEMGARKIIRADTRDLANVVFFECTCLEHSQHLVSLSALKTADQNLKGIREWTYYSSLATTANVLRDVSQDLYATWTAVHGPESAKKSVKSLFPKACSGRWSGCERAEQRFLQCGQERLAPILTEVLTRKMKKDASSDSKNRQPSINDIAIEACKEYSERMGRWRRRSLECVKDGLWWRVLKIMNATRQPLAHFSNLLHRLQKEWNHIPQLAMGKVKSIAEEFYQAWEQLVQCGCVVGDDDESKFVRNFAFLNCRNPVCLSSPFIHPKSFQD